MSRKKRKDGRRRQQERDAIATDAQDAVREHDLSLAGEASRITEPPAATVVATTPPAPAAPTGEIPGPGIVADIKAETPPAPVEVERPGEPGSGTRRTERRKKTKPPESRTTRTTRAPAPRPEPPPPPGTPPKTTLHETRGIPAARIEPPAPPPAAEEQKPPSKTRKYIDKAGGTLSDFVSATRRFLKNFTAPAPPEVRITLPKDGDIRLFKLSGELDERLVLQASTWMLFVQAMKADADIVLTIDSPGGSVTAGLSLVEVMLKATCRVRTHCARQALGVASLILASGSRGYRTVSPGALLGVPGSPLAGDGRTTAAVSPRVVQAFMKATGKSEDEIRQEVLKLKTVTPKLAVKYGMVDAVGRP